MSRLTQFAQSGFSQARGIIGGESLTVGGGPVVSAVSAEVDQSRDYDGSGFDRAQSLTVVVSLADWDLSYPGSDASYLGKSAEIRGITWRVGGITSGVGFVRIGLTSPRKGA